jgi:proteasome accessory factor C
VTAPATTQLNRIVQLVAELSRRPDPDEEGVPIAEVAERLGATAADVTRDLRTLTDVNDSAGSTWLLSLRITQEGDRVSASSRGPFRRPLRFTPLELLAIQLGIAWEMEDGGSEAAGPSAPMGRVAEVGQAAPASAAASPRTEPLSAEFAKLLQSVDDAPRRFAVSPAAGDGEAEVVELAQRAVAERRVLRILYAAEHDLEGVTRRVEPHQVAYADGRWYVVAWCRHGAGWRHFRADRVLDAVLEDETFAPRPDHRDIATPAGTFRQEATPVPVRVRFSPAVARWLAERYPDARPLPGGALEVEFQVLEPHWLVRHVLQYGADAEVLEPPAMRALMRRVTSG